MMIPSLPRLEGLSNGRFYDEALIKRLAMKNCKFQLNKEHFTVFKFGPGYTNSPESRSPLTSN